MVNFWENGAEVDWVLAEENFHEGHFAHLEERP